MINRVVRALLICRGHRVRYLWNLGKQILGGRRTTWFIRGTKFRFYDRGIATLVIFKEICAGTYEPPSELRPGDTVLDIGAHVGMFSIPLARDYPTVQFICVEPDEINYRNLCRNIAYNGVHNVTAIQAAIGPPGFVGTKHDHWNSGATTTAPYGRIPSYPIRHFGACRLLKIDTEGGEYSAIESAADIALADNVIIEIHRNAAQSGMVEKCKGARIILE